MYFNKGVFGFILLVIGTMLLMEYRESLKQPYEEGIHIDYSIHCENGFVYKTLNKKRGTIQVFNSDGTPLKCGEIKK